MTRPMPWQRFSSQFHDDCGINRRLSTLNGPHTEVLSVVAEYRAHVRTCLELDLAKGAAQSTWCAHSALGGNPSSIGTARLGPKQPRLFRRPDGPRGIALERDPSRQ